MNYIFVIESYNYVGNFETLAYPTFCFVFILKYVIIVCYIGANADGKTLHWTDEVNYIYVFVCLVLYILFMLM